MTVSNIQSDQIKYRYTQNCLFLLSKIIEYLNKESNLEFKTILEEGISVLFGYMISILYNKDETVEKVANLNQSQLLYFPELIYINAKVKINPDLEYINIEDILANAKMNPDLEYNIEDIFNQKNNYETDLMDKFRNSKLNVDLLNEQLTGLNTDQEIATKIKDQLYDQPKKMNGCFKKVQIVLSLMVLDLYFPIKIKHIIWNYRIRNISLLSYC